MNRQHRMGEGRTIEVSPMGTGVERADDGLPAGTAECGECPGPAIATILKLVVHESRKGGGVVHVNALVQVGVELVDALSGLDMDQIRFLFRLGKVHVLEIVAVEAFGYDIS